MAHTVLPWKVVVGTRKDGTGEDVVITTEDEKRIIAKISPLDKLDAYDLQNAALIVRAVNSYERLLDACKNASLAITDGVKNYDLKQINKKLTAAIAAAEVKA